MSAVGLGGNTSKGHSAFFFSNIPDIFIRSPVAAFAAFCSYPLLYIIYPQFSRKSEQETASDIIACRRPAGKSRGAFFVCAPARRQGHDMSAGRFRLRRRIRRERGNESGYAADIPRRGAHTAERRIPRGEATAADCDSNVKRRRYGLSLFGYGLLLRDKLQRQKSVE